METRLYITDSSIQADIRIEPPRTCTYPILGRRFTSAVAFLFDCVCEKPPTCMYVYTVTRTQSYNFIVLHGIQISGESQTLCCWIK